MNFVISIFDQWDYGLGLGAERQEVPKWSLCYLGYLAEFKKWSVNSTFPIQSIPLASYYDSEYSVAQVDKDRNRLPSFRSLF